MSSEKTKKVNAGTPYHSADAEAVGQVSGGNKNKKVFVGMSGGVDSSVSALLLKQAGFDVTGVFIKVWQPEFGECTWKADREDAMKVAARIGIKFRTLDLEKEYKKKVVDYMIEEYKKGRTPNPDVMCNLHVKFGKFFDWAMDQGADHVATGHYAKTNQKGELLMSADEDKDQTYFLWKLNKEILKKVIFPVGDMTKIEVRQVALENNLQTAGKRDSVGVCFIGEMDMKEFLSDFLDLKRGNVLNPQGEIIGTHEGAELYTLGQRRGFEVTKKGPADGAHYVISKDLKKNTITVVSEKSRDKEERPVSKVYLTECSWISGQPPSDGKHVKVRFRHRQPLIGAIVLQDDSVGIKFQSFQKAVAPGQSLVMYDGENCLGGGVIHSTIDLGVDKI